MPLYEFKCPNCEEISEFISSYEDSKNQICKKCNSKLIVSPSVCKFKIKGFNSQNGYS